MNKKSYIFWIRSSRGTDSHAVIKIDGSLKKDDIRSELERWCSSFGAWNVSENFVSYGWAVANKTNLNKLNKYLDMKKKKYDQLSLLTTHEITINDFYVWREKNKNKMAFPFKCS